MQYVIIEFARLKRIFFDIWQFCDWHLASAIQASTFVIRCCVCVSLCTVRFCVCYFFFDLIYRPWTSISSSSDDLCLLYCYKSVLLIMPPSANSQRIHCINCNVCLSTFRRYLVHELNTRVISLLSEWISPVIVSIYAYYF